MSNTTQQSKEKIIKEIDEMLKKWDYPESTVQALRSVQQILSGGTSSPLTVDEYLRLYAEHLKYKPEEELDTSDRCAIEWAFKTMKP